MIEWVIKGEKAKILPLMRSFCEEFNRTFEELKNKEITVFKKKIGKKVGEYIPFMQLACYDEENCIKVDLVAPIPDVLLFIQKKNLTRHIKEFLDKNGVKADVEMRKV
ncbi:MAG: hypothetical protein QW734_06545 [Candidatus Bathyarchaeia archaeon]